MADPVLEFDPAAEGTGTALTITTGNYGLITFSAPAPPPKLQWAGSVDTEGSALAARGHENRVITISLEVTGATALADVQSKLAKLHREGGTLKYTSPAATAVTADVLVQDGFDPVFDHLHYLGGVTACQFSLTCKPYLRGAEQDLGDNVETTLPALVFTEASIPGDVPALGRLVIDDDSAVNQWWLTWGVQSRYYSSSANAALFYEAEGRTALGGSATAAGPTGASGAGSNVMRNTALTLDYLAILSTQATGAGAHLSHVGSFRAYARVQVPTANTGEVTVALEWSEADFLRYTRNATTTIPAAHEGQWRYVDLGLVSLTAVTSGTQRWEGRIVAKSTVAGDDIDIDYLLLIPASEGSGVASGVIRDFTPTAYVGEDRFTSTTAGNALNTRSAPTGGTWATSGDATDLAFDDDVVPSGSTAGEHIKRSTTADTNGRFAILGSTNYANVMVEARVEYESINVSNPYTLDQAVIARWTDSSNYLRADLERTGNPAVKTLKIVQVVSGTATTIASGAWQGSGGSSLSWWKIRLNVDSTGRATAVVLADTPTSDSLPVGQVMASCEGSSPALATGGTLATGKPGYWDRYTGTSSSGRYMDDFLVASFPADAAAFASQSVEIRHDRVQREDSGGALLTRPSSYTGDYLLVPASGAEARTARVVVKMARNDPLVLDNAIDDLSARLFVTPRYLAPPA